MTSPSGTTSTITKIRGSSKNEKIGVLEYWNDGVLGFRPTHYSSVDLNRVIMERYRPAMREYYLKDKPVFS